MSETQVKIDDNTLEITSVRVHKFTRQELEKEKEEALNSMARAQNWLDNVNIKLIVLNG